MIISEITGQRYNKFKGIMRYLPHTIMVNDACRFSTLDCYISVSNLGVTDGKVLSITDGVITVYCTNSISNSTLKINSRFLVGGQAFKISGIDTYSQPGIMILSCEKDLISTTDDVVNNIAGALSCPIDITNTDTNLTVGVTLQLDYTSTNDVPVTFTSSNPSIATVSATGLVTGISEGVVTISMSNSTNSAITDVVTITVEDIPIVKTVSISVNSAPITELKVSQSKTYTANVYEGDVLLSEDVTWNLYEDDQVSPYNTANVQITATTGTTITLKGVKYTFYVQLKCTLNSDPSVFVWQRIKLRSLI